MNKQTPKFMRRIRAARRARQADRQAAELTGLLLQEAFEWQNLARVGQETRRLLRELH